LRWLQYSCNIEYIDFNTMILLVPIIDWSLVTTGPLGCRSCILAILKISSFAILLHQRNVHRIGNFSSIVHNLNLHLIYLLKEELLSHLIFWQLEKWQFNWNCLQWFFVQHWDEPQGYNFQIIYLGRFSIIKLYFLDMRHMISYCMCIVWYQICNEKKGTSKN